MDSVDRDFLGHLERLVSGSMPPDQFWIWLARHADLIDASAPAAVADLARGVDNRFAEWTGGFIDDGQLIAAIRGDLLHCQDDLAWPRSA